MNQSMNKIVSEVTDMKQKQLFIVNDTYACLDNMHGKGNFTNLTIGSSINTFSFENIKQNSSYAVWGKATGENVKQKYDRKFGFLPLDTYVFTVYSDSNK